MVQRRYEDDLDLPVDEEGNIGRDRLVPSGFTGSRGPVNIAWQLQEGLRKFGRYTPEHDVFPFAYDWRLGVVPNAAKLHDFIERVKRDTGSAKVDVVTHSAGSLLGLWALGTADAGSIDHLVLIAPTQHGVADAFRVFVQPEKFLRREFTPAMVATWPFIEELLPENGRFLVDEEGRTIDRDLWQAAAWDGLVQLDAKHRRALERSLVRAREVRQRIASIPRPAGVHVSVIAGDCVPTARRVLMRRDGTFAFYPHDLRLDEKHLAPLLFEPGDGTVPVSSAGRDAQLFCDGHQGIATDPNVVRAIVRTLRE